jgi:hypothetical protein
MGVFVGISTNNELLVIEIGATEFEANLELVTNSTDSQSEGSGCRLGSAADQK